jgi:hypothetical protein
MGSVAVIYVPSLIKIGSGVQTLKGGDTQTHSNKHTHTHTRTATCSHNIYDAGTIPRANNTAVSTSKFNSPEDGSV